MSLSLGTQFLILLAFGLLSPPLFAQVEDGFQKNCEIVFETLPNQIVIPEKTLNHILVGDFGKNPRTGFPLLKGGLHTFEALGAFLSKRPDLFELGTQLIEISSHATKIDNWYFLTTSSTNGVGHLRLPQKGHHKKSLKALMGADIHFQGSYLWKTLFPRGTTKESLENWINEVFKNPQLVTQRKNHIVLEGYTKATSRQAPINMRLLVDPATGKLISAYPTFNQPGSSLGVGNFNKNQFYTMYSPTFEESTKKEEIKKFEQSLNQVLKPPLHKKSILFPTNYYFWNKWSQEKKLDILRAMFLFNQNSISGGIMMIETLAIDNFSNYQPFDFTLKGIELIHAFAEDPTFTPYLKVQTLLEFLVNQTISHESYFESMVVGKVILGKILDLAQKLEIGEKKELVRIFELSPAIILVMESNLKKQLNPKKPTLSLARFLNRGSYGRTRPTKFNSGFEANAQRFVEELRATSDVCWTYFKLVLEIQELDPNFLVESQSRKKMFADLLNGFVETISWTKSAWAQNLPDILFAGHRITAKEFFPENLSRQTLALLQRHKRVITDFLFSSETEFSAWIHEVHSLVKSTNKDIRNLPNVHEPLKVSDTYQATPNDQVEVFIPWIVVTEAGSSEKKSTEITVKWVNQSVSGFSPDEK